MRTHRKVLCILFLAILVTASTAVAEPTERPHDGRSIGSWALSVLDSIAAFLLPVEAPGDGLSKVSGQGEEGPSDASGEAGGSHVPPASFEAHNEPSAGEIGGGVDPHG